VNAIVEIPADLIMVHHLVDTMVETLAERLPHCATPSREGNVIVEAVADSLMVMLTPTSLIPTEGKVAKAPFATLSNEVNVIAATTADFPTEITEDIAARDPMDRAFAMLSNEENVIVGIAAVSAMPRMVHLLGVTEEVEEKVFATHFKREGAIVETLAATPMKLLRFKCTKFQVISISMKICWSRGC
jgi:hypothetical protein